MDYDSLGLGPRTKESNELKIGDCVVCVNLRGCELSANKEYTVIKVSESGTDIVVNGSGLTWDRRRFKLVVKTHSLAPGLQLIDLKSRRGVAPELKLN